MERAALSLAAAAVSPIIAKLGAAASSYFGGDITRDELDQLQAVILPKISTVIEQAERIDAAKLRPWLTKLEAAVYEAEDVLDMYEYNTIKNEVSHLPASLKKIKCKAREIFAPFLLKTEMKQSLEKLKQSADEAYELIPLLNLVNSTAQEANVTSQHQRPPTVSGLSSPVFGRDDERQALVNMLTAEPGGKRNIIIHAIHGIGGAGKTTLAQYVFNDARVQEHYNLKIWVHVSRTFDTFKITKEIIEGVEIGSSAVPVGNLDVLQRKLKEALRSTRFLLVLDDVWTEDMQSWDQLLIPMHQGGEVGSRILITTRLERTVLISRVRDENIVSLDDLKIEECRSIFKYYAFDDADKVIADPELADVCEKALCNLKNSPLAARLAGSLVRKNACNVGAWRRILTTTMLGETMSVILLSFQHLPPHLQRCFSICSLYQKGYTYDSPNIDELVRLWIAHGYVEATCHESLEDKGRLYFDDLFSYSLFQGHPTRKDRYVMHDLVHDLAEMASRNYCFRIEGDDPVSIPPTVIHLSVVSDRLDLHIANILRLGNLRTIIIFISFEAEASNIRKQTVTMFEKLTKLRVLHFEWWAMPDMNISFGKLKHLRYLELGLEWMKRLPESLGTLYHLQYIRLNFLENNVVLRSIDIPKSLNNLVKLRHVYPDEVCLKIDDIGKLISLQELEVYGPDKIKKYGLQQLENLQQIRGRLTIKGLQFVKDEAGASIAMLKKKRHLEKLILIWGNNRADDVDPDTAEAVFQGLEPHPNLKLLAIWYYNGAKQPDWMLDDHRGWLLNLTSLNLLHCPNLTTVTNLPWQLRVLTVKNCPKLMQLCSFPCSLEVLEVIDCLGTGSLLSSAVASYNKREQQLLLLSKGNKSHQHFALKSLKISHDSVLEENTLNDFLMNKFLCLSKLEFTCLPSITSLLLGPHLTSLEILYIVGLENLRSIKGIGSLTYLKRLTVKECPELTTTARAGGGEIDNGNRLHSIEGYLEIDEPFLLPILHCGFFLNSLVKLEISQCSQDVPFSAEQEGIILHLTSLKYMYFKDCDNLPSLPGSLGMLSSLEELRICDCNKIELLPNLPSSLKFLWIGNCHPCLEANYKEGGLLRHEINHIPNIVIYGGPRSV